MTTFLTFSMEFLHLPNSREKYPKVLARSLVTQSTNSTRRTMTLRVFLSMFSGSCALVMLEEVEFVQEAGEEKEKKFLSNLYNK
jgi:hypothetical protein